MSWFYLVSAGIMEVCFTFCLGKTKVSSGTDQTLWWCGFVAAMLLSLYLMARASRTIPIGTVYPVWTGIGAAGAVLIGIFFFDEPASFKRIFFISTLIISIVGLKIV